MTVKEFRELLHWGDEIRLSRFILDEGVYESDKEFKNYLDSEIIRIELDSGGHMATVII